MKYLVDNQLPPALVRFLKARGCDAEHVRDIGLSQATDAEIWEFATKSDCVLISKDEDFMQLVPKSPGDTANLGAPRQLPNTFPP